MPDLGKAVYSLILSTKEFDAGLTRAEQRALRATTNIERAFGKADAAVASIGPTAQKAAGQVEVAAGQMSMAFTEEGAAAQKAAATNTAAATKTASAWKRAAVAVQGATASMLRSFAASDKAMIASGKRLRMVGRGITHAFTLPAAIIGGVAVKWALDFHDKIELLQNQAGATASEMEHMREGILKMVDEGSIHSAEQLADAMFHIQSTGIRGADALEVLRQASNGAMVGEAELEGVTNALVGAIKSGITGAEDFGTAMGTLNAIIGAGNMRMDDLVGAMSTGLLPAARAAGISFAEIGAAVAVFTSRNQPAQISATRLGMALAFMQKHTPVAAKALAKLGIGTEDLALILQRQGLSKAIDFLNEKMAAYKATFSDKDLAEVKANQIILSAFGGGKSGRSMLTLVQNADALRDALAQVTGKTGEFGDAVKRKMLDPSVRLGTAWSKVQGELIKLGEALIPTVIRLAEAFVKVVKVINALPRPVKMLVVALIALLAVAGPLLSIIGLMTIGLGGLSGMFVKTAVTSTAAAAGASAFRLSLVGKLGLYGAALAAGYAFGTMVMKLSRLDGVMRSVGGAAYDLAAKIGLVNDEIAATPSDLSAMAGAKGGSKEWQKMADAYRAALSVPDEFRDKVVEKSLGPGWTFNDVEVLLLRHREPAKPATQETKGKGKGTKTGIKKTPLLDMELALAGSPEDVGLLQAKRSYIMKQINALRSRKNLTKKQKETLIRLYGDIQSLDDQIASIHEQAAADQEEALRKSMELPIDLQIRSTRAERTKTLRDDMRVAQEEEKFYRGLLKNTAIRGEMRLEVEQQLTAAMQRINDLIEQGAKTGTVKLRMPRFERRLKRVRATDTLKDNLRFWRDEKSYLKSLLKQKDLEYAQRLEIQNELERVNKKIEAIKKKEVEERQRHFEKLRQLQAVMDLRGSFFSQFAGNIFGQSAAGLTLNVNGQRGGDKSLTVNQNNNYNEIPRDRHGHARHQQRALSATMDSM